jgi:SAM-dependent methyltransferase
VTTNKWRKLSAVYPFIRKNPISFFFLQEEVAAIKKLLTPLADYPFHSVSDLGCGRGHSLVFLPKTGEYKIAFDNCQEMIARTRFHYPDVCFIQASACALPLQPDSLDFVSCIGLLEYIEDLPALFSQIFTVLENKGYLLLTSSPPGLLTTLRRISGLHLHPRNQKELERIILAHNFVIKNKSETCMQYQYLLQKKNKD